MSTKILVTGATGFIGRHLVKGLIEKHHRVRAISRSAERLKKYPWASHPAVELITADLTDRRSMIEAAQDCSAAYYLVHSMLPGQKDFAETDRKAACNMRDVSDECGLKRIIYLSGLGEESKNLSRHLRSRAEVGEILRQGKAAVTILRAAMVIGAASASYEILKYLVRRLPVMITPRWVSTPCQPIAVRNVIEYLVRVLECEETAGRTYDIGGAGVVSYRRLMEIYAEEAGLRKRLIIPTPVLSPQLSSYWISLVTPMPASIARPLAEGLRTPVVVKDGHIRSLIPQHLLDCREAIRYAIKEEKK
jgi:uncharacterized protein YbjT (DUF2867 family)